MLVVSCRGVAGPWLAQQLQACVCVCFADDPKVARELQFFERVKQRLRNKEAYADFLKCE